VTNYILWEAEIKVIKKINVVKKNQLCAIALKKKN